MKETLKNHFNSSTIEVGGGKSCQNGGVNTSTEVKVLRSLLSEKEDIINTLNTQFNEQDKNLLGSSENFQNSIR